ncbi:autotransporter outer membrane beta-barrel domain-containing protein [uncultured Cedecea sp.]|uniref:autotransporter outer membrane beta-barrel domain-containing protein n=1 Tax=uncultured Cedecea sp. TaxID=988762 RepID=UPI00260D711B|nr:autotransporter outer membrane beta-barrel domain-containing protein [uncultured Cedecea sp.]
MKLQSLSFRKKKFITYSSLLFLSGTVHSEGKDIILNGDGITYILESRVGRHGNFQINGNVSNDGGYAYKLEAIAGSNQFNNITKIESATSIFGGDGGRSENEFGYDGINGGNGGDAIIGGKFTLTNFGTIKGGNGGEHTYYGFDDERSGNGGNGGNGISGTDFIFINHGAINGGYGALAINGSRNPNFDGSGGNGGNAVSGQRFELHNNGSIRGGNGERSLSNGSNKSHSGNGGDAVSGSNFMIINNGKIIAGTAGSGNTIGTQGNAIRATGGSNTLILNTNSTITGDIILDQVTDKKDDNTLLIKKNALTTLGQQYDIVGNMNVGTGTAVTLANDEITFSGGVHFNEDTMLALKDGGAIDASHIEFSKNADKETQLTTSITKWQQQEINLLTTKNGITGYFTAAPSNLLLTEGATDYADINITDKNLTYSLKWFSEGNEAYGTFDLKQGAVLDLNLSLTDNLAVTNQNKNGWDGTSLTKAGEGNLILSGTSTYTGKTLIAGGMLTTAVDNAIAQSSDVTVASNGILNLAGTDQKLNNLNNKGIILIEDAASDVDMSLSAESLPVSVTVAGNMFNSGILLINDEHSAVGHTYTQDGNWVGNGLSHIIMSFIASDDNSKADRLNITGNASGTTSVKVNNIGGTGEATLNGIKLINIGGTSTSNAFVQFGRIVAGAYDYRLVQGNAAGQDDQSWYLSNSIRATEPKSVKKNYRPEGAAYTANIMAANTLFNLSLNDRPGETRSANPLMHPQQAPHMWIRNVGGHQQFSMNDSQNKTTANRYVLQIGGDIARWSLSGNDRYHLGLMAGYATQHGNTVNKSTGNTTQSRITGYSTGLYGTYFQNDKGKDGLFVDSWLQYSWFNSTIKGNDISEESDKNRGITASLESGYTFNISANDSGNGLFNAFYLQPKAQVIWMGVKAKDHRESNGTLVHRVGNNNLQTRLGARMFLKGKEHLDKKNIRSFEPFAEANWIHNTQQYGVRMDEITSAVQGSRNIAEFKAGIEGNITQDLNLWASVTQQIGDKSYRDTGGLVGVKYNF